MKRSRIDAIAALASDLGIIVGFSSRAHKMTLSEIPISSERHGNKGRQHCPNRHHSDKRGAFPQVVA